MDRGMWQDHLIMCSKLIVEHAKLYTQAHTMNGFVRQPPTVSSYYPPQTDTLQPHCYRAAARGEEDASSSSESLGGYRPRTLRGRESILPGG